jgi:hypothetical protein
MRTTTAKVLPFPKSSSDPIFAAIDRFWKSYKAKRNARQRLDVLLERLPKDETRRPRVHYGNLLQGYDAATGNRVTEPIYRTSKEAIDTALAGNKRHQIALCGKDLKARKNVDDFYKNRRAELIAQFEADAAECERVQLANGYSEARVVAGATEMEFYKARHNACHTRPTTIAGALAGLHFLHRVEAFESWTNDKNFWVSGSFVANLVRNCTVVLDSLGKHGTAARAVVAARAS